jgi:murein DD-endopeptidase MepM/ murein hydrolase activator NlpD
MEAAPTSFAATLTPKRAGSGVEGVKGGRCRCGYGSLLLALGGTLYTSVSPLASPAGTSQVMASDGQRRAIAASGPELPQQTRLSLPFSGTWVVGQGYHGSESHHGYAAFALDMIKLNPRRSAFARKGRRARDWYGFGADVLATADGLVVHAIDRFPDNRIMGRARRANALVVKHRESEYSEYVHLRRGSLRVRVGDQVVRGQVLASCGNSGAETPHLHWALLSSVEPVRTRPAVFSDYEVQDDRGAWRPGRGTLSSGDVIRPAMATVRSPPDP